MGNFEYIRSCMGNFFRAILLGFCFEVLDFSPDNFGYKNLLTAVTIFKAQRYYKRGLCAKDSNHKKVKCYLSFCRVNSILSPCVSENLHKTPLCQFSCIHGRDFIQVFNDTRGNMPFTHKKKKKKENREKGREIEKMMMICKLSFHSTSMSKLSLTNKSNQ